MDHTARRYLSRMLPSILRNPYIQEQVLTRLSNKAPGNAMPILPIEGAVTGGRSFWGWKRTGFLELQERFFEEVAVAIVWLFGVHAISKVVDKGIEKLQDMGMLRSLYTDADWSKDFLAQYLSKKKTPSILLSPLEKFSHHFQALKKTMAVKGLKLGISVAIPLFLCGYAIPRLNQLKTEWLLKKFYSDPSHSKPHEKHTVQPASNEDFPKTEREPFNPASFQQSSYRGNSYNSPWQPQHQSSFGLPPGYTSGYRYPYQPVFGQGPVDHQNVTNPKRNGLRFGSVATKAMGLLGHLGHYINNTAYGEVLAVDTGITGGRMWTAWPRSPYESFEYGARDIGSLYFYLMSVPMFMSGSYKAINSQWFRNATHKFLKKDLSKTVNLDAQVSRYLASYIGRHIGNQPVDPESLRTLLHGASHPAFSKLVPELGTRLRQAETETFKNLLKTELMAFCRSPEEAEQAKHLLAKAEHYLHAKLNVGKHLSADQLETFLKATWTGPGGKTLTRANQFHLSTAAKLSFQHSAGLTQKSLTQLVLSQLSELPKAEKQQLLSRLTHAAQLGGDKVIASTLRRSLNATTLTGALSQDTLKEAEAIIRCVERASVEGVPVNTFIKHHLAHVISESRSFLKYSGKVSKRNPLKIKLFSAIHDLETALVKGQPLSQKSLEDLAKMLEKTTPQYLRWLEGFGLDHLAEDVRLVIPLVGEKASVNSLLESQIQKTMENLLKAVKSNAVHAHQLRLLQSYDSLIQKLLSSHGERRVALMLTKSTPQYNTALINEVMGMLKGGLRGNGQVYQKALRILHRMPSQAEKFFDPSELKTIENTVNPYLDLIETRLAKYLKVNQKSAIPVSEFMGKVMQPLVKYNSRWRLGLWSGALVASMVGVGIVIPKLQYWMTLFLTGSDTHPGLAAVEKRMGIEEA